MWPSASAYTRFCAGTSNSRAASRNWSQFVARSKTKSASAVRPGLERGPAQRDGVAVAPRRRRLARHRRVGSDRRVVLADVGDERAVRALAHGDRHGVAALDLERLLAGRQLLGLAVVQDLVVVDHLLQVEVLHVRVEVGEAPGDRLVVADDHARAAPENVKPVTSNGQSAPTSLQCRPIWYQTLGMRRPEVRVVGEDRRAAGGVVARDRPGVRPEPAARSRRAVGRDRRWPGAPAASPPDCGSGSAGRSGRRVPFVPGVLLEDAVDDRALVHDRLVRRVRVVGIELARSGAGSGRPTRGTGPSRRAMLPPRSHAIALSQASESTGVHFSGV